MSTKTPKNDFVRRTSRWWLPTAFVVSVLLHLLLGWGGARLLLLPQKGTSVTASGSGIDLVLTPGKTTNKVPKRAVVRADAPDDTPEKDTPQPARPAPRPDKQARTVVPDTPQPQPTREQPKREQKRVAQVNAPETPATPEPRATPAPREPAPREVVMAQPQIEPVPTTTPVPRTTPPPRVVPPLASTEGGKLQNKLPVPLPKGDESGLAENKRAAPTLHAAPRTIRRSNDEEAGGGGSGVTATITTKQPDGVAAGTGNGTEGGADGGSGGGAGGGTGTAVGAGGGAGLGITRGVPFGDRLGITNGDPRGGGGFGTGAGGAGAGGLSGFSRYGGFRIRRPSGGGPPVSVVYVVDVSGSMEEGNKIGKAREALAKAIEELRPEDKFMLISFSDKARKYSPGMLPATAGNISAGEAGVALMEPSGATDISAALDLAFAQPEVTHIFLLSDGEPTEGITDFDKLLAFTREHNESRARIITLALGLGEKFKGIQLLKRMADENNGRYSYIDLRR